MKAIMMDVVKDQKGLFPIAWGQPNDHFMDWRGCNYHYVNLPGWPRGKRLADTSRSRQILCALLKAVDIRALTRKMRDRTGRFFDEQKLRFID